MATDTLFDKVRVLVQGANSANQAAPIPAPAVGYPTPVQFAYSGVGVPATGVDHVVLSSHALNVSINRNVLSKMTITKGDTNPNWHWMHTSWPSTVTVEIVLEINPAWPVGAIVAKFYGLEISIESAGLLRFKSRPSTALYDASQPAIAQSFTRYIGTTPGKVYIACVMRMEVTSHIESPYEL